MLNEEKVRLMAKAYAYEINKGKELIDAGSDFEDGRGRKVFISNVPMGIITFILVFAVIYALLRDQLHALRYDLGNFVSAAIFIAVLVIFSLAYAFFSTGMLRRNHAENRGTFWKYRFNKNKIKEQTEE